jgi:prepilin-type N-terminal cleavage/methylation domain-containing protein
MKQRAPSRQHGVTLIELLLGLAITALVLAPLAPMFATASNAARITADKGALEQDASFALARISARIRATAPSTQLPANQDDWLKPSVYVFANGILAEQLGGASYTLAESVTAFTLSAPESTDGQALIRVSLSLARGGAATTASATVRMGGLQ